MQRICASMVEYGYDVLLVGRVLKKSKPLAEQPYKQYRISCFFEKGKLFYAEYNFRLFLFLLSLKVDAICAIDLDTILPCFFVSRLRKKPLVYDAHEYFSELEEVIERPAIKRMWERIEQFTVPKIVLGYTVSKGIAEIFNEKYGVNYPVVRNVARLEPLPEVHSKGYLLYQGAVNEGRGLRELIDAMKLMPKEQLMICGEGDIYVELKDYVKQENLTNQVTFTGYVRPVELRKITQQAYLGFTLFTDKGLSNTFSLANRFFDYFHNGVPQIAVNYPEYRSFCEEISVASLIDEVSANAIAKAVQDFRDAPSSYEECKKSTLKAREIHNWQKEAEKLKAIYNKAFSAYTE